MRKAVFKGSFYPSTKQECEETLEEFFRIKEEDKAISGVVPHAGWVYSGATAAHTYKTLAPKKTFVLLGPDHTGMSFGNTCVSNENWETPLGVVKTNNELVSKLGFMKNDEAHAEEHSIEVQLPFLQYSQQKFNVVCIMMGDQGRKEAEKIGKTLAKYDVGVIASSDFSHYVPKEEAFEKDLNVIQTLEKLDVKKFYDRIEKNELTACGYGPIAAAATFAKIKGAKQGKLLNYTTSPGEEVVGYASIIFV